MKPSRREFIEKSFLGAVAAFALALFGFRPLRAEAKLPALTVANPVGKALGYKLKSPDPKKRCDKCSQFVAKDKTCKVIPGHTVLPGATCNVFVAIP